MTHTTSARSLGEVFDDHVRCEFELKDADAAIATMTEDAYRANRVDASLSPMPQWSGSRTESSYEHNYWDQASLLIQIGLLDPARLRALGVEQARKVADKHVPSNELMHRFG
jgi:hypothetical protein